MKFNENLANSLKEFILKLLLNHLRSSMKIYAIYKRRLTEIKKGLD